VGVVEQAVRGGLRQVEAGHHLVDLVRRGFGDDEDVG
jgi:hypothetical protein